MLKEVGQHNHDSNIDKVEVERAYQEIRERSLTTQEATAQVLLQSIQGLSQGAQGQLPSASSMRKVVRKTRVKVEAAPPEPMDLQTLVLPNRYKEYQPTENAPGKYAVFTVMFVMF